jgi:hypothetical protein
MHKWNFITDTCEKCGIVKRKKPLTTRYTLVTKGYATEYFVNNEWINKAPLCLKPKQ